jgi:hypothetical protein
MPDLRTEMLKTINTWDKPVMINSKYGFREGKPAETTNERLFNWVKVNPNVTVIDAKKAFPKLRDNVIATLLKKMVDTGILGRKEMPYTNYKGFGRKTYFVYYAVEAKYRSLLASKPKKLKVQSATAKVTITKPDVPFPEAKVFDAQKLVQTLNLYQAKEVYALLKAVFDSRLSV